MKKYFEPIIWTLALCFLFFMDMNTSSPSFCVFKFMGLPSCPGCGIGHAIHAALHFNFQESLREHLLGIPATIAIFYTIIQSFLNLKQNKHTWTNNKC